MLRAKHILILTVLLLALTALPVFAEETATPAAADAGGPTGITTLVILAGFGAMLAVGGMIYARENAKNGKEVD